MNKKFTFHLGIIFFFALLMAPLSLSAQERPFQYGAGTRSFPYEINSVAELVNLANLVNQGNAAYNSSHYQLMVNIDLSSFSDGAGWIPIGHSDDNTFMGHFDGNGRTISNLYINDPLGEYDNVGLFGWIRGGSVRNLSVTGANINGADFIGGIAGYMSLNARIENCRFSGDVTGSGYYIGGIAGRINNSEITGCYATGAVAGDNFTGGIAGSANGGSITNNAALNENVTVTNTMANFGCITWPEEDSGYVLSGNISFAEMNMMIGDFPINHISNHAGMDGESKTGLELRFASGFPAVFSSSPWRFFNGALPSLTTSAVTKPQYLTAILISLNLNKDGTPWNNPDRAFSVRHNTDQNLQATLTGDGANSTLTATVNRSGTWRVFDGDTNTGVNISTNNIEGSATFNYFTVSFDVEEYGTVSGSTINATYDGNAISSGDIVRGGSQLIITTTGAGITDFLYNWSGAGTNNQTTNRFAITSLNTRVDAVCHVATTNRVEFNTVSGNGSLMATVDGVQIASGADIRQGKDIVFTAMPNLGYVVHEWTNNGQELTETEITYTIPNLMADHTVTVEFEYVEHEVTFSVVDIDGEENGSLTAMEGETAVESGVFLKNGVTINFFASPAEGYRVKEWRLNGVIVPGNRTAMFTLESLTAQTNVTVEFEILVRYITFDVEDGNGTLTASVDNEPVITDTGIQPGKTVIFTAIPNERYKIAEWIDNGSTVNGVNQTYTVEGIDDDHDLSVRFEHITHPVTFNVLGGNGNIAAAVDGSNITSGALVLQGKDVVFTALPNANFKVRRWTVNGDVVLNYTEETITITEIELAQTVTVEFEAITYEVNFAVTGAFSGTVSASVSGGVGAISSPARVQQGRNITFTTTLPSVNHRAIWKHNDNTVSETTTYTLNDLRADANVTVEFEFITHVVTFGVAGGMGDITATVGGTSINSGDAINQGSVVVFSAAPDANYQVKEWTRNGVPVSVTNPLMLTVNNIQTPIVIAVEFELVSHLVSFHVDGGNGDVSATVDNTNVVSPASVQHGKSIEFTANPNSGYRVSEWTSNGSTINGTSPFTLLIDNIAEERAVTVKFEPIMYEVTFDSGDISATVSGGIGEITTGAEVRHGSNIVFTTTLPTVNHRAIWKLNGVEVSQTTEYTLINITNDAAVTVEFVYITHIVTFNVVDEIGGDITATVDGISILSGAAVNQGSDIVFTATSETGYRIRRWMHNNSTVNGRNGVYAIENVAAAQNITIEFEQGTATNVYFSVVGINGEIKATADGVEIDTGDEVAPGSDIVFTATPNNGYRVAGWTDNENAVNATNASYLIIDLDKTHDVKVSFQSGEHTVTHAVWFEVEGGNGAISANDGGSDISNGGAVAHNAEVVIKAKPEIGYEVKEWKINGVGVSDYLEEEYPLTVTSMSVVTVAFKIKSCVVNFDAIGNGSLAATLNGAAVSTGDMIEYGKEIIFTANPANNYRVKEWKIDGEAVPDNTTNSLTLNITEETEITVEFEIITYNVTFSISAGEGSLTATVSGAGISSGANVAHGSRVVFTAVPAHGYRIAGWENGASGTSPTHTIYSISATQSVSVEFELIPYQVTFNAGDNGNISANIIDGATTTPLMSSQTVLHGHNVKFTATPDEHFTVKGWTLNGADVPDNETEIYNLAITAAATVHVEFKLESYEVTFSVTDGNGNISATTGGVEISSGAQIERHTDVVFAATPEPEYRVKEWKLFDEDDNEIVCEELSENKTNNYTITNLTAPATVTVAFEADDFIINFGVNAAGNGALKATVDQTEITTNEPILRGKEIVFTAEPETGYRVKEWKIDGTPVSGAASNSQTLTVAADTEVIVSFELIPYVVTFHTAGGNGSLSATVNGQSITSGTTVLHFSDIVFTAVPASGYRVREWNDGNDTEITNNTIYTIDNIAAAHNVSVTFELITYQVTFGVVGGNGSLSATVNDGGVSSGAMVRQGRDVVFTARPNTGYRVKEWKVGGDVLEDIKTTTYTLENMTAAVNVTVEFELSTFLLTFSVEDGEGGTITATANGQPVTSGELVNFGSVVIFEAEPVSGYRITEWYDNGDMYNFGNKEYTINGLSAAHNVVVTFVPITYEVEFKVVNGANGRLDAKVENADIVSVAQVRHGRSVVFTAIPNEGYHVIEWTDNNQIVNETGETYTINNLEKAHTITVEFEIKTFTVTFDALNNNGMISAIVHGANIQYGGLQPYGTHITFTAIPADGYRIKEWKDGNVTLSETSNVLVITHLTDDAAITVEFELAPPVITTTELPMGTVDIMYGIALTATGGTPMTWSLASGVIPEELELSENGMIFGIPFSAGTFPFSVKAENETGSDVKNFVLIIEKGAGAILVAPTVSNSTSTSITINELFAPGTMQTIEYAINNSKDANPTTLTWQTGLTFSGLSTNVTYFIFARAKENENYTEGPTSVSAEIKLSLPTNVSELEPEKPLTAYLNGGRLYVRGLPAGKLWSVYNSAGALIYRGIAPGEETDIPLQAQGVFIIQTENGIVRVVSDGR